MYHAYPAFVYLLYKFIPLKQNQVLPRFVSTCCLEPFMLTSILSDLKYL